MNFSDKRGWKPLNRIIMENWIWESECFDNFHAWADLYLSVNHTEAQIPFNNTVITIEENCMLTSENHLSKRWGWSRKKVSNFLKKLSNMNMISYKRIGNGTYLKVHNNAENLYIGSNLGTTPEPPENTLGTITEQTWNTNNNKDNKENEKNKYNKNNKNIYSTQKVNFADNVLLTMEVYCTLIEEYGEDEIKRAIEILDNYKTAHGKSYADDSAALRSWAIEAALKEKKNKNQPAYADKPQQEFELLVSEDIENFENRMLKEYGLIS